MYLRANLWGNVGNVFDKLLCKFLTIFKTKFTHNMETVRDSYFVHIGRVEICNAKYNVVDIVDIFKFDPENSKITLIF
jgi:hypothetical protein